MNETLKDVILVCIAAYIVWFFLVILWRKFTDWWKGLFVKKKSPLKSPRKELSVEEILGKSKFNLKDELAKREQQAKEQQQKEQERLDEEARIKALATEMAKEMVQKQSPPPQEEPHKYPRVIPVEELDAVFSNEEVLPDYSMPDKFDKMIADDSATTIGELENVAKVLKNREPTTVEQQQEAVRVIAKIDNTFVLDQMLSQIDGATKYASHLIEKHYTEQLTPYPKPHIEEFDMGKYLNYEQLKTQ